jgi:hypothetical protein
MKIPFGERAKLFGSDQMFWWLKSKFENGRSPSREYLEIQSGAVGQWGA